MTIEEYKARYKRCLEIVEEIARLDGELGNLDESSYEYNFTFGAGEAIRHYKVRLEYFEKNPEAWE